MKYIGSKNRISKELAPIIQEYINENTVAYIEPFVGGANMIDKISHDNKIGYDIHKPLIELLNYISNLNNRLPQHISEEEYNALKKNKKWWEEGIGVPLWYLGLVGFCSTYGARWFEGYARSKKSNGQPRDMSNEAIRNLEKQRHNLIDIKFHHSDFRDLNTDKIKNCVIYCDIPYKDETKDPKKYYNNAFPYNEFYEWCKKLSQNNKILVSEYTMPKGFRCIWEKPHKVGVNQGKHKKALEKLFVYE